MGHVPVPLSQNMKVYDLTHSIKNDMMIFPGDPEIYIAKGLTHESDYCHVDQLHLNSHTGTHIDAPYHFLADGKKMHEYPAEKFVLEGRCVNLTDKEENEAITKADLEAVEILPGQALILATGWDQYFGTEKYLKHPFISKEAAEFIVEKGVSIVAVDFLNVDQTLEEAWDAHPVLLSHDCLIVENLAHAVKLDFSKTYLFEFLPLKIVETDGSPVRAVALQL